MDASTIIPATPPPPVEGPEAGSMAPISQTRHVPRGAGVQSSPGGIVFVKTRHEPLGAGGQSNAAATRGPGGMSEEDQGQGEDQVEDTKAPTNSPGALRAELEQHDMEGKTVEMLTEEVRDICLRHGVMVSIDGKERKLGRTVFRKLVCVHHVDVRSKEYESNEPVGRKSRRRTGQRSRCKFEVHIRWPFTQASPRLSQLKLVHDEHAVRPTTPVIMKRRARASPVALPMKVDVAKPTGAGFNPGAQALTLEDMHEKAVNNPSVQNAVSKHGGPERALDVNGVLAQVQGATAGGGFYELRVDEQNRLTHVFWMTAEQVALIVRYGTVILYDDTAVKNKYRLPLGLMVVIDGNYNTRIVGQSLAVDTTVDTTETFVWMLKAVLKARGDKQPSVFIQGADAAMEEAVKEVFPGTIAKRCLFHLRENITEHCAGTLGADFQDFMDTWWAVQSQVSLEKFEQLFNDLIAKYPKVEVYMGGPIYNDRASWAEYCSPLTFSVGSWTTSRVEGMNAKVKKFCNTQTSLTDVFKFLNEAISDQKDLEDIRTAQLELPQIQMPQTEITMLSAAWEACEFPLGHWPRRFMQEEMGAAMAYCVLETVVLDRPRRREALKGPFKFIGDKVVDVEDVAGVIEMRKANEEYTHYVARFRDGSHLCTCRTLQTLGLCCRHFWAAMLKFASFKFHVGLVNEHWLTERARVPTEHWPPSAVPKWVAADRFGGGGITQVEVSGGVPSGGCWMSFSEATGLQSLQSTLDTLKDKGPTVQDRKMAYADVYKTLTLAASVLADSLPPDKARMVANSTLQQARTMVEGQGAIGILPIPSPDTVRLPARTNNKRAKSSTESRCTRNGIKRGASSSVAGQTDRG